MIRFLLPAAVLPVVLFCAAFPARAQEAEHARARLIAEQASVAPGGTVTVGLAQDIDSGWHTYWKNPGDSGQATALYWHLPKGWSAGPLQWPAPHKIPAGPLVNYGYEGRPVILQDLTAPADLPPGPVTLEADVEILVCADICIPEQKTVSLTLNGGDGGSPDIIEAARAALPRPLDWPGTYAEESGRLALEIRTGPGIPAGADFARAEFFPAEWGIVVNAAPQTAAFSGRALRIEQNRDTRPLTGIEKLTGVLVLPLAEGGRAAYEIAAAPVMAETGAMEGVPPAPAAASLPEAPAPAETAMPGAKTSVGAALLFALLGGLILNLMPCVFPVLSIKALSLVKLSEKHPGLAAAHGIAYTAGILLCFGIVAGALIALKGAGAQIGWGFHLQNPAVVLALAYLVFVIGLNLTGLFEIGGRFGSLGSALAARGGLPGSFFTGVLATLVATPCTAPFMAAALGFALVQPAPAALAVFMALGLGLALPYLLLSTVPPLRKALPRPGPWMETFRQFLAFPMFASAVWLVWVLAQQTGADGVLYALAGMVAVAFGLWLIHVSPEGGPRRVVVLALAVAAFALAAGTLALMHTMPPPQAVASGREAYSAARLEQLLSGPDPVFVEMTAAWCITCKVNERVALAVPSTEELFHVRSVHYLVGDWTNYDPAITEYLSRFGRSGVPIYVYYGPPGENGKRPEPAVLPQLLTPGIVARAVDGN